MELRAQLSDGPDREAWEKHQFDMKLVNPANKRKYTVIVVGTGLAGAAAAASLAELGYNVTCFCFQDSPRRAHSIAAQGGINAAKNYQNDGDSVYRLFYDTVKGGDFRAREANVYRLAELSRQHHRPVRRAGRAVRARVRRPARQPLVRRRAGLAHVLRARPDRPAAAARRLPGARAADRRSARSTMYPRHEMLDLVVVDGQRARHRHARPGHRRDRVARRPTRSCSRPAATATSSTSRRTRRAATSPRPGARTRSGAAFAQPLLHADPPDLHPGHRRLPVEADADERVAAQRRPHLGAAKTGRHARAGPDPRGRARLLPRAQVPELRQPRAARHRLARRRSRSATRAAASGPAASASTSTSRTRSSGSAQPAIAREVRQPVRHVRAHHRREPVQGADAHLPGRRTTRWAGCGSTTT